MLGNTFDDPGQMMDEILREAVDVIGVSDDSIAILERAASYSTETVNDIQERLKAEVPPGDSKVDVIVLGSYARQEASLESDFDYLIIPHSLPGENDITCTRKLAAAVESVISRLQAVAGDNRSKGPGTTGLFGKIQSAADLVERIGLEQDTNATHTRRALILQESTSIYDPSLHDCLIRSILARYLVDYERPKPGAPRFLLNDLNRYWFTVAVDYQAKRWERLNHGWGIRYLKLLITRRLSYVGAIVPLLLCDETQPAELGFMADQYSRPALARFASLALRPNFEEIDHLRRVLECAARFNHVLSDSSDRSTLDSLADAPVRGATPIFDEMHDLTNELDASLRAIFSGSLLAEPVKRYLIL